MSIYWDITKKNVMTMNYFFSTLKNKSIQLFCIVSRISAGQDRICMFIDLQSCKIVQRK